MGGKASNVGCERDFSSIGGKVGGAGGRRDSMRVTGLDGAALDDRLLITEGDVGETLAVR